MKTLVLIRHAHRDTTLPRRDNGLSPKGRRQAMRILRLYREYFDRTAKPRLIASPSRRCMETLAPLARWSGKTVRPDQRLRERGALESQAHFTRRRRNFLTEWKRAGAPLTIVCSHGDWLPAALRDLTDARATFKKSAWAQVLIVDGKPELFQLIQPPQT